jgi:hypothetical protein
MQAYLILPPPLNIAQSSYNFLYGPLTSNITAAMIATDLQILRGDFFVCYITLFFDTFLNRQNKLYKKYV